MRDIINNLAKEQRLKNLEELRQGVKNIKEGKIRKTIEGAILKKVENYCKKWEFMSDKEVLDKILIDDVVASFFAKDPMKQNLSEKAQLEALQQIGHKVEKLPAVGNNKVIFSQGQKTNKTVAGLKTTDFYCKDLDTYFMAKYTNEAGGAQDNQFNDVLHWLKEAQEFMKNNPETKCIALVDGDYYTPEKLKILKDISPLVYTTRDYVKSTTGTVLYR